ncbi:acetate--CoA ligase family protein [bacterium]|nr:acetate--CoA ligase family protein [bacterium]MBU4511021.1 acetate--CoA ligase family protein [bacterium]
MKSMENFFNPHSVAIFASMKEGKTGYEIVKNMVEGGFKGKIYPVSQSGGQIFGVSINKDFKNLEIDLAIIAVPGQFIPSLLEDLGSRGVKSAVIISAGFSEVGNFKEEKDIKNIAEKHRMRIIGPNCAGIMNTGCNLFASIEVKALSGETAFITQSGALGGAVLMMAEELGFGFSKFVSYGNRCDVDEVDLIKYLENDPRTKVIALYMEGLEEGRRFLAQAKKAVLKKPMVAIKAGKSKAGIRAASSHTGSLAGEDKIYDAAFRQAGILRVEGVEEMFDLCRGLINYPKIKGNKIGVVTNSGGPAVLATDKLEELGLMVSEPSENLKNKLKKILPPHVSLGNPFDLLAYGGAENFARVSKIISSEYDAIIVIFVPTASMNSTEIAAALGKIKEEIKIPIFANFMAGRLVKEAIGKLKKYGIPNYETGERCAKVIQKITSYTSKN